MFSGLANRNKIKVVNFFLKSNSEIIDKIVIGKLHWRSLSQLQKAQIREEQNGYMYPAREGEKLID